MYSKCDPLLRYEDVRIGVLHLRGYQIGAEEEEKDRQGGDEAGTDIIFGGKRSVARSARIAGIFHGAVADRDQGDHDRAGVNVCISVDMALQFPVREGALRG